MDKKEIILYCILFWILLSVLPMSGCSHIDIDHTYGELPRIEFPQMKRFCSKDFDADIDVDEFMVTCEILL